MPGKNMSPARVFFGFAVFVTACAFLANAIQFEVFEVNAFLFVCAGTLACCAIACSTDVWKNGFQWFTGKADVNAVQASGFWNNFGTYAWYCGVIGAFMSGVAYAGSVKGGSSLDNMLVPAMYCFCYGMFFKVVGTTFASACCGGCTSGDASTNAMNQNANAANQQSRQTVST